MSDRGWGKPEIREGGSAPFHQKWLEMASWYVVRGQRNGIGIPACGVRPSKTE